MSEALSSRGGPCAHSCRRWIPSTAWRYSDCDWRAKSGATKEKMPPAMNTKSKRLMIAASAEGTLNLRSVEATGASTVHTINDKTTGKIPRQKMPMISPSSYQKKQITTRRITQNEADLINP